MKNSKNLSVTMVVLFALTFSMSSCTKKVYVPVQTTPEKTTVLPNGEVELTTFCIDESYDKPGEYMAGLGIAEDRPSRDRAIVDANRVAIDDIASRYIGIIKNAIQEYSKDTNVPSGKKVYESSLEGGVEVIGKKVIEKYANAVCRKYTQSATGGYVGYVAVHVLLEEANKGLAEELEVRKVDFDKEKLLKHVNESTNNSIAR